MIPGKGSLMAVFGEEEVNVPINQGIAPTAGPYSEKFCPLLKNLILNSDGELVIREDVISVQALSGMSITPIPIATNPVPINRAALDIECFVATGIPGVDSPSALVAVQDNAVNRYITWTNSNSSTGAQYAQNITSARAVKAFCQYRDRYYGSNVANTIFRISNFSITPSTNLVITDLVSVSGVNLLFTFKNRVFGIAKNRIYYTDLPALGGYPEVWNTALNFVDVPTSDMDLTVYNFAIYKDRVYLFSDRGIYVFLANGSPTNWSIQLVSNEYIIQNRDSVGVNRGFIFFTDQFNVYAFNGVTFKKITGSLEGFFRLYGFGTSGALAYTCVKLYPFLDGVLLECVSYIGPTNYTFNLSRLFYFDLQIWIEWANIDAFGLFKAGNNLTPYRNKLLSSYMVTAWSFLYVDRQKYRGDCYDQVNDPISGRVSKVFEIQTPSVFLSSKRYPRIKYLELFGYFNDTTVNMTVTVKTQTSGGVVTLSAGQFVPYNQYLKVSTDNTTPTQIQNASFMPNIFSIDIVGTSKYDKDFAGLTPPIVFSKIAYAVNTDNKDRDQMSNI